MWTFFFFVCFWFFVFIIIKKMLVYIISGSTRVLFMFGDFLEFCFFYWAVFFFSFFLFFSFGFHWWHFWKLETVLVRNSNSTTSVFRKTYDFLILRDSVIIDFFKKTTDTGLPDQKNARYRNCKFIKMLLGPSSKYISWHFCIFFNQEGIFYLFTEFIF